MPLSLCPGSEHKQTQFLYLSPLSLTWGRAVPKPLIHFKAPLLGIKGTPTPRHTDSLALGNSHLPLRGSNN